jgi:protein-tyrosine-phosphatase
MAEGIFKAVSVKKADEGDFLVMSRGLNAFDGDCASKHSVNALKNLWNIDISLHKAKMLSGAEVAEAYLLLTMTRQHRDILRSKYPAKTSAIFTLKEYAFSEMGKDSPLLDISDPYGMNYSKYESCAIEIYDCVKSMLEKIN